MTNSKQSTEIVQTAEIIAIGSELTTGAKLDTNSQWLSLQLAEVGIPVQVHSTVADDLIVMVEILRDAVARSDIVLVTGGLGPTLDDLTRQSLAELTDTELVLHETSLEFIKQLFVRRKREMPERNAIQAMFPEGSEPIVNPRGSAPGIWQEIIRPDQTLCKLAAMPGVPSEMKRMFKIEVLPRLAAGNRVIQRARVNCFGVGESTAEEMLGELTARGRDPEVGITVHEATITLRITASGPNPQTCADKIASTKDIISQRLGDLVFGEEDEELEHAVVKRMNEHGFSLSTAESGTGGLLAHRLTEVDGFERCYHGGVVTPTGAATRGLLNLDDQAFEEVESASAETARQMATGCRARWGTDFALAVTECQAFEPDAAEAHIPNAYIAFATPDSVQVCEHTLIGDPAIVKSRAAKAALNLLRLFLMRQSAAR